MHRTSTKLLSLLFSISLLYSASTFAQEINVSGRVVTDKGEPLMGVIINVIGKSNGGATGDNGEFLIKDVGSNDSLSFSFIGYAERRVAVAGQSKIDVILAEDARTMQEIVKIGYGTQERRTVSSAIVSVSGEVLTKLPVTSVEQMMQGRLAGVTVTSTGEPGGGTSVRIRGLSSIGNNEPLYVVDGVPLAAGSANLINPADIESVDVLKDAASAAIYGSRGANGVILLTLKKGRKGRPTMTFSSYMGVQSLRKKVPVLNAREHATVLNQSIENSNLQRDIARPVYTTLPDTMVSRTDWQDEIFQNAMLKNYDLNIAGGTDKSNFSISGGYRDEKGIILNTFSKRYTLRASYDTEIGKRLKLGSMLNLAQNNNSNIFTGDEYNGILTNAMLMPEQMPVFDADGAYAGVSPGNITYLGRVNNPVGWARRLDRTTSNKRAIASMTADVKIFDWLTYTTMGSGTFTLTENRAFDNKMPEGPSPFNATLLTINQYLTTQTQWNNFLVFNKKFADVHDLTVHAGTDFLDYRFDALGASKGDVPADPNLKYLNMSTSSSAVANNYGTQWALFSYIGRINYTLKDRYILYLSLRRDGTSRFLAKNRYAWFPGVSAAYVLSEEEFMKGLPIISFLKLRASYGVTGNQDIFSDYPYEDLLGYTNPNFTYDYAFGTTRALGGAQTQRANPDIRWEQVESRDIGFELGVLENKITLVMDYFVKNTKGMLIRVPLPSLGGSADAPYINAGTVRNSGLETSINYNKKEGLFTYSAGLNFSTLQNRVLSLSEGEDKGVPSGNFRTGDQLTLTGVGQPISSYYGWQTDGIFQSQAEIDAHAKQNPLTAPGDIRFKDQNNDGVVDDKDRVFLGSGIPKYTYGFNLSAGYKGFDASIFFQGVAGVKIYNGLRMLTEAGTGENKTRDVLNAWTPTNTNTNIPRLTYDDPNMNNRASDRFVENGNFFRLRNFQIGYTIPKSLIDFLGIQSFRLYASVTNLFVVTKYKGHDPEVGTRGNDYFRNLEMGIDRGIYPQPRMVTGGIVIGL